MSAIYESQQLVAEYLLFHYGCATEILAGDQHWPAGMHEALDFPVRTVAHFSSSQVERGLDLGCAVGRSSFEMSRQCAEVIGIDFSKAFIEAAQQIKDGEEIPYPRREEAATAAQLVARIPAGIEAGRVSFEQGDAMNLRKDFGKFDRVHAANLICRLPEPRRLLDRLPSLVRPGGELVLATPCTWLEEFTPQNNWPVGGTYQWLLENLAPEFKVVTKQEEPFLIRETARKFQWTRSLVTVWRRHD